MLPQPHLQLCALHSCHPSWLVSIGHSKYANYSCRRYADVVVHRQLLAAVAGGAPAASPADVSSKVGGRGEGHAVLARRLSLCLACWHWLSQHSMCGTFWHNSMPHLAAPAQAAVMNERHRTAKRAQKDCSDLYLLLLLHAQVAGSLLSLVSLLAAVAAAFFALLLPPLLAAYTQCSPAHCCQAPAPAPTPRAAPPPEADLSPNCLISSPSLSPQPHVEAATVYGLRRQALLVFLPKYHLKVGWPACPAFMYNSTIPLSVPTVGRRGRSTPHPQPFAFALHPSLHPDLPSLAPPHLHRRAQST